MKRLFQTIILAAFGVAAMTIIPGRAFAESLAPVAMQGGTAAYVPGEVLVKFQPTLSVRERKASVAAQGNMFMADLAQGGLTRVRTAAGQAVEEAIAAYEGDPNVEYVQPNYIYHITATPNVTEYNQLWAFKNTGQTILDTFTQPPLSALSYTFNNPPGTSGNDINIEKAWDLITDCSGTAAVVAVVDTGVNYNQQDLQSSMWSDPTYTLHGINVVDGNNDPMDKNGHGTHVAGIIGASGDSVGGTTSGVCWKASVMAVRVLDASGSGTTADIISGINFAVTHGAKVINMSLGGGSFDSAYSGAIDAAQAADVVVVVAAGNSAQNNDTTATYPCNFTQSSLICVAALDQKYGLATFSNYGATSVDVGAPGTNILSTWAGTNGMVPVDLTTGWTFSSTTAPIGGWFHTLNAGTTHFLVDPSGFPNSVYASGTDDRVYKSFDLSAYDAAVVQFGAAISIINNDFFRVASRGGGGDPFAGGTTAFSITNTDTHIGGQFFIFPFSADISSCVTGSCTVGFQLTSTAAGTKGLGVGVTFFNTLLGIETLVWNTSSYNTINGTSMATPEVAGLAAMLRAYNPLFTAADVVGAIKNGGRATASLSGKTSTGKAIDVMSSLSYVNPPSGLSAAVQ